MAALLRTRDGITDIDVMEVNCCWSNPVVKYFGKGRHGIVLNMLPDSKLKI